MAKDLSAQLSITAEASGVEAGVGKAKRSLADLGATAAKAGKEGAQGFDRIGTASASAKRSIDASISRLQVQAATVGKSAADVKLYELAHRGASRAQLDAASAALRTVAASKQQAEQLERASIAAGRLGRQMATLGVLGGTALLAIGARSINALDAFNDLKDATGASIENISALDRVARETGSGFDTVATTLVKFNQVLSKAGEGSEEASRILKALKLNSDQLRSLDPAEALRRTAVALSTVADEGDRARATQVLFGKSVREVAPLLNDLATKTTLVATTSTETAEQAERFNKQLYELRANATDASRAIASSLIPSVSKLAEELLVGLKHSTGLFDAMRLFGTINPFRTQAGNIIAMRDELIRLEEVRSRYQKSGGDTRSIDREMDNTRRQLEYLKELQSRQALAGAGDTGDFVSRRFQRPTTTSLSIAKSLSSTKASASEAQRYLETLQKTAERTEELTTVEQALRDIQAGRVSGITPKLREQILLVAGQIDASKRLKSQLEAEGLQVRDLTEHLREQASERERMLQASSERSTRDLMAGIEEASAIAAANEALREEIQIIAGGERARIAIEQARISSTIALKEETLAMMQNAGANQAEIDVLKQQIDLLRERARLTGKREVAIQIADIAAEELRTINEIASTVARGFEDALVGARSLKDALGGIGAEIQRILTRELITKPLTDSITGIIRGSGGGGGLFGGIFGADSGGGWAKGVADFFSTTFGGSFASGGRPGVGRPSIVGENGMELFIPDTPGRILSAADTKAALASSGTVERRPINITNHFAISGQVGRGTQEQIAARVGREVRNAQSRHTA
jgi:hypothetical protein